MAVGEAVKELRRASPTTLSEVLYTAIIFLIGIVILLQPDSVFGISGINPVGILDQPGWIGLLALGGSPSPLLLTKFGQWALASDDLSENTENTTETEEEQSTSSTESEEEEKASTDKERVTEAER